MIVLLCFILTGCKKEEIEPITITVIHAWGSTEADHVAMRDIYQGFQDENPDVRLQLISMPTRDKMLKKVEDMIMVGDIPDIVCFSGMGQNRTYDFMVENNMALDLMPYLESDPAFAGSISNTNLKYWVTEDNQLFSISDVLSLSGGYWYNKDILQKAGITEIPSTWDEFLLMCERLSNWSKKQDAEIKPLQPSAEGYLYFADHMLADNGGYTQKAIQNNQMIIIDDEFETVIKHLKEVYNFSTSESENYSYLDETSLFNEGKLAIYVNGVWGAPMIAGNINAKYALLPTESGNSMSCTSTCLGYVLGNSENEEKEEASVRFIKYMLSENIQTRILQETEQIPANPHIDLSKFEIEKPRLYQAASLVLSAERKIEVPDNLWIASKKNSFIGNVFKVLSGELSDQGFEGLLK